MTTFPEVRVGDAVRFQSLTVFPLFAAPGGEADYLLSDEAIKAGVMTIEEVSEGGAVPTLLVKNVGDARVLFLEGEALQGAKQNRVLNTSVLIAAHSQTAIPVSCVEQGRWRYQSQQFSSGKTHSSSKLRHRLKETVSYSLMSGHGFSSDQGAVWSEVQRQMESLGSASPTGAMSDTYESHKDSLKDYAEALKYVDGASGLAVAVGSKVVALDLFDKPATCEKVWQRLLTGVVMDALEEKDSTTSAQSGDVLGLLNKIRESAWVPAPAVGEGQEFRSASIPEAQGSALVFNDVMLHGSVVAAG